MLYTMLAACATLMFVLAFPRAAEARPWHASIVPPAEGPALVVLLSGQPDGRR